MPPQNMPDDAARLTIAVWSTLGHQPYAIAPRQNLISVKLKRRGCGSGNERSTGISRCRPARVSEPSDASLLPALRPIGAREDEDGDGAEHKGLEAQHKVPYPNEP